MSTKRRVDPDRRNRLIEVTLEVIAEFGVSHTTHRRVAEAADVPLGSMTYHFKSIEELITLAFIRLSTEITEQYLLYSERANNGGELIDVITELLCDDSWFSRKRAVLMFELYAYSARSSAVKDILSDWTTKSIQLLERYFTQETAKLLDSVIGGIIFTNNTSPCPLQEEEVRSLLTKVSS